MEKKRERRVLPHGKDSCFILKILHKNSFLFSGSYLKPIVFANGGRRTRIYRQSDDDFYICSVLAIGTMKRCR
jgi:hypothetical protein